MTKKLNPCILLAFLAFSPSLFSQNTLYEEGLTEPTALVTKPYFYWDYLRTLSPEWIRESKDSTGNWKNLEKVISFKDAGGRFTELDYQPWQPNPPQWDTSFRTTYKYTLDANNRLTEMESKSLGIHTMNIGLEYNTSGKMTKASYSYNGNPYSECLFSYNTLGQRITDTTKFAGSYRKDIRLYEYDANGRCIQYVFVKETSLGADTFEIENYTYSGNMLTSVKHSMPDFGGITPYKLYEFTYSGTIITGAAIYDYDAQSPVLYASYKHYYSGNRLTAITEVIDWAGVKSGDSLALRYDVNDRHDTSYQYKFMAGNWETNPSGRLTFKKLNTGMAEISRLGNMAVYPNPAADYITVEIETLNYGDFSLDITDVTGKRVKTVYTINMPAGKNTIRVPLTDMASGVYYLNCGTNTVKIVKE